LASALHKMGIAKDFLALALAGCFGALSIVHARTPSGTHDYRQLGHGGGVATVSCTGCTTMSIQPQHGASRYSLTTFPHRDYGAGSSFTNNLTNVELWMVDCVYLKCGPIPSCPATGRRLGHECGRQLGHGGASAVTAPLGWYPDPTVNTSLMDFCDLRSMVKLLPGSGIGRQLGHQPPSNVGKRAVGVVFHSGFMQTCTYVARTYDPVVRAKEAGLLGLLILTVTDPVMVAGHVPIMGYGNPVPDFPILTAASTNTASQYASWSARSRDTADMISFISILLNCNSQTTSPPRNLTANCAGNVQTLYADLIPEDDNQNLNSGGAVFLYVIVGIGFVFQVLLVVYLEVKHCKRYSLLQQSVLLVEGFVCAVLRAYRQFVFPTAGGMTNDVSYPGMWFLDAGGSLESSLSTGTTFLTISLYVKMLFAAAGCPLAGRKLIVFDAMMLITSFLLMVALIFLSVLYPFQPWLIQSSAWSFLNNLGNSGLKAVSYRPAFYLNIIFAAAYIICAMLSLLMLFRVAKRGQSTKIMGTIRKLLKYILAQVVGLTLVVVAVGIRVNWTLKFYYSVPYYGVYWIQLQFQGWGNLLSSWGALMTVVLSTPSSSSSSSSSSSPPPPPLPPREPNMVDADRGAIGAHAAESYSYLAPERSLGAVGCGTTFSCLVCSL